MLVFDYKAYSHYAYKGMIKMKYKKLQTLRKKKNYTCLDMARFLGISKPFYCQLENQKRRLTYEMAIKIANIFNTHPDKIFYEEIKRK